MEAPRSEKFRQLQAADRADAAVKSSIAGRRRTLLERIFEFAGKRYRVVSLGERKLVDKETAN